MADALEPALVSFVLDQGIGGLLLSDAAARDVAACLEHVAHGRAVLPSGWQGALSPIATIHSTRSPSVRWRSCCS